MAVKHILVFVILGYSVVAEESTTVSDFSSNLTELLNKESFKDPFAKKCEENAGPDGYKNFTAAENYFRIYRETTFNITELQQQIEVAKPKGQTDEVFKKYCDRMPELKSEFSKFMETVKLCFGTEEQETPNILVGVVEKFGEFACEKDGNKIAMFFAGNGTECIQSKSEGLKDCLVNTILEPEKLFNSYPTFFKEEGCHSLKKIEQCAVQELLGCSEPTTANFVESMSKYLRQNTPCQRYEMSKHEKHSHNMLEDATPESDVQGGSATGLSVTMATIISAIIVQYF